MIQEGDQAGSRRKQQVLGRLLRTLPTALKRLGVADDVIEIAMGYLHVDVTRMKLASEGGMPWQTFAVERAAFALSYANPPLGYRLFKSLVLGLTLITPPRSFYGLRSWYSAKRLSKLRGALGEPKVAGPTIQATTESNN